MIAGLPCPHCPGQRFWEETARYGRELICLSCGFTESVVEMSFIEDMAEEFSVAAARNRIAMPRYQGALL